MDDNELPGSGVSLAEYFRILRRRRATILQSFVLLSVVGLVLTSLSKPLYQASAKLLVEGPSLNVNTVDNGNPMSSILTLNQQQTVATDVEVLQAQPLLARVAQTVSPATLSVATLGDTDVIEVSVEANDPKIAADAANALLTIYMDEDTDSAEDRRLRLFLDCLIVATMLASTLAVADLLTLGGLNAVSDSNAHLVVSGQTYLYRLHSQIESAPAATPTLAARPPQDAHPLTAFLVVVPPFLLATAASPTRVWRRTGAEAVAAAGLATTGALVPAGPGLLAGLAALLAFGIIGLRALGRGSTASLHQSVLAGTLAGVAAQAADAAVNPAGQSGPAPSTLWLLLGLGTACTLVPPAAPGSRPPETHRV